MANENLKELFDGWPENQADIAREFTGKKAKNVYPNRKGGELPICLCVEETEPSGESGVRYFFPNSRGEFVVAEKDDQGQLQAYSPKISLFAKHPKDDPDDAYFIVSATGNLKATLHKNSAHVKLGKDRLIHCLYPPLDAITPKPILRIAFPSFGLSNRSSLPVVKKGRLTHLIAKPPKGFTAALDFCLHRLPMYEHYYNANPRIVAVASDYRRYVLVATVAYTNTIEDGPSGLKEQLFDQIRRPGKEAYRKMLEGSNKGIEAFYSRCDDDTTGPLMLIWANNLRDLVQEAFS